MDLLGEIGSLADANKEALGFWSPAALKEAVSRKKLFALVSGKEPSRKLAGYVHYSGVFPHAKVQQVAVMPEFRRTGAATVLIQALASNLEAMGYLTIKAEVADNLLVPLKFYPKNGFVYVRSKPGGKARKRSILVHVRELDNDDLFSAAAKNQPDQFNLGIRRRSAGDDPLFAFDLNVYFDLVRERKFSEQARELFGSALAHHIRLAVADEFVNELSRTSTNPESDPMLQMALRLPRLPKPDAGQLATLRDAIHDIVFVTTANTAAGSDQALSDAGHLAHAALSRASAFVTRDGAILAARDELLLQIGIDVISLDELLPLLPHALDENHPANLHGEGFAIEKLGQAELKAYLAEVQIGTAHSTEFGVANGFAGQSFATGIRHDGQLLGVGMIQIPRNMEPVARMLVHVKPENVDADLYADYLIEACVRQACKDLPTLIEMVHLPGQSASHSIAISKGFIRDKGGNDYRKVALGRPLTEATWANAVSEIRRRTGLELPSSPPSDAAESVSIVSGDGSKTCMPVRSLEDFLGPALFVWPNRDGVIVPIGHSFANELLGTNEQSAFAFVTSHDAAFLSRRAYVNSPRTAKSMLPDSPILFYESKRSGGKRAVIAIARITDVTLSKKDNLPEDRKRRLVVDDVDVFSATDDVLLTTFDNLFVLPAPVSLKELQSIGAAGNANLITATPVSGENITQILTKGWPSNNAK